jgi:hypothetical protein
MTILTNEFINKLTTYNVQYEFARIFLVAHTFGNIINEDCKAKIYIYRHKPLMHKYNFPYKINGNEIFRLANTYIKEVNELLTYQNVKCEIYDNFVILKLI